MDIQIETMTWEGVEIQLTYKPLEFDGVIAHLEVQTISPKGAPLPFTDTGYRSHFHPVGTVEANEGTLVEQVTEWLNAEAKSKQWQRYLIESRQLSLF